MKIFPLLRSWPSMDICGTIDKNVLLYYRRITDHSGYIRMERKERQMNRIRGRFTAVFLAVCLLVLVSPAGAENNLQAPGNGNVTLMENAIIDGSYDTLCEYDAAFRNLLDYYPPEVFSGVPAVNRNYDDFEYGAFDDSCTWQFGNGCELTCSCLSLTYGNADSERYGQLLTYMDNANINAESDVPDGFSLEDAVNQSDALFRELNIENLVPDQATALPCEYIRELTGDMIRFYGEAPKLDVFRSFGEDISAWYLTFRQEINGLRSMEEPQVSLVVTKNGIALLTITTIIDRVENVVQTGAESVWQDALDMFTAFHGGRTFEEYSEKFEIEEIRIGYDTGSVSIGDNGEIRGKLFPCWRVDALQTLEMSQGRNGETPGTRTLQMSDTYRITGEGLEMIRSVGGVNRK